MTLQVEARCSDMPADRFFTDGRLREAGAVNDHHRRQYIKLTVDEAWYDYVGGGAIRRERIETMAEFAAALPNLRALCRIQKLGVQGARIIGRAMLDAGIPFEEFE